MALIAETPEQKFHLELLKAIGLPPDLKTRGLRLDLRSLRELPVAHVTVVLFDDQLQQAIEVLLRYGFRVSEIEVGSVIDLVAEDADDRPGLLESQQRRCRVCGCTDDRACPGGCRWVDLDLCSRCAEANAPSIDGDLSTRLNKLISDQVANLRTEIEGNMTKIIAPLVARASGSVTLSAADLGRPWSLSVLELPGGDVTLVAVELEEQEERQ